VHPAPAATRVRRAGPADAALLSAFAARTFHDTFAADNRPEDMAAYVAATFTPGRQLHGGGAGAAPPTRDRWAARARPPAGRSARPGPG